LVTALGSEFLALCQGDLNKRDNRDPSFACLQQISSLAGIIINKSITFNSLLGAPDMVHSLKKTVKNTFKWCLRQKIWRHFRIPREIKGIK